MNDVKTVSDRLEALLREKGVSLYEHSEAQTEKRELNTEKADFTLYRTIFSGSVSVSVIMDGKKGSASGNDLTEDGLKKVVEDAITGALSSMPDEANAIAEKQETETFHAGPWDADMPRFYTCLTTLFDTIRQEYPQVNLLQAIADHTRMHRIYRNSSGTCFEQFDAAYHVGLEMSGSDGEKNTGIDYAGISLHELDTPLMERGSIRAHLEATEKSLHAVALPGKFEGTVIFTPDCLGSFLDMLASNYLTGSVIMEGTSQWLNRLDEKVANEKISIALKAEDPRIVELSPITGDGYRAENVTIMEKGVLKSFLLGLYAARKTGRTVTRNSGSALVMEAGDTPLAQMIASVKKGLIVGGFSGGHPGANGEFSGVAKNSFLIEDGKILGAVTETMINGNLEKVFQDVVALSSEQICDGNTVLPYMASKGIVISGK